MPDSVVYFGSRYTRFGSSLKFLILVMSWLSLSCQLIKNIKGGKLGPNKSESPEPNRSGNPDRIVGFVEKIRQEPDAAKYENFLMNFKPRTPPAGNIFFIFVDTLRFDYSRIHGPHMAAFMDENFAFKGVAPSSVTNISTYAFMNSLPPFLIWKHLYGDSSSRADNTKGALGLRMLKRAGYSIHSSGDYFYCLNGTRKEKGWDEVVQNIFGLNSYLLSECDSSAPNKIRIRDISIFRDETCKEGTITDDVLEAVHGGMRNSLVFLYFYCAHTTYRWDPKAHDINVDPSGEKIVSVQHTPRNIAKASYGNAIAYIDHQFGRLIDGLKAAEEYDDATIFLTADHGESMGEKDADPIWNPPWNWIASDGKIFNHGNSLFREQIEVPLTFKVPKARMQTAQKPPPHTLASTMDIMPTLLDATNLGEVPRELMVGKSLISPQTNHNERSFLSVFPVFPDKSPQYMTMVNRNYKIWINFPHDQQPNSLFSSHEFGIFRITDLDDVPIEGNEEFSRFGIKRDPDANSPLEPLLSEDKDEFLKKIRQDFREAFEILEEP